MKYQARRLALKALLQIEEGGAYSQLLLNQLFNQHPHLDPRDKSLVTEIVYGTLQHRRLIDFHLQPFLKQNIDQLNDWVRQLLRLSIYQLLFLDRVPDHAVVHEAVEISKRRGHRGITGMVNGVLRQFIRSSRAAVDGQNEVEQLAIKTSHPTWMVRRWVKQYGLETTQQICAANNRIPEIAVRVNSLKTTRDIAKQHLQEEGFEVGKTSHSDEGLLILSGGNVAETSLFKKGHITIQDESSMLVAPLLAPQKGMHVLDACAAPGGKTTHMATLMNNEGRIIANDIHAHKQHLINQQSKRLGISIIKTMVMNAEQLHQHLSPVFDRILVDAPCSGFGVIRRKPDLKWAKKEKEIGIIADLQYRLLSSVSRLLKKDGQLVYSTCTLEKEENQGVIDRFLEDHPQFAQLKASTRQILPQDFDSDGFFMTKLERT